MQRRLSDSPPRVSSPKRRRAGVMCSQPSARRAISQCPLTPRCCHVGATGGVKSLSPHGTDKMLLGAFVVRSVGRGDRNQTANPTRTKQFFLACINLMQQGVLIANAMATAMLMSV
jgi:hypothetical protein